MEGLCRLFQAAVFAIAGLLIFVSQASQEAQAEGTISGVIRFRNIPRPPPPPTQKPDPPGTSPNPEYDTLICYTETFENVGEENLNCSFFNCFWASDGEIIISIDLGCVDQQNNRVIIEGSSSPLSK